MQPFVADQNCVIVSCTYYTIISVTKKLIMNWSRQKIFSESRAKEVEFCDKQANVLIKG